MAYGEMLFMIYFSNDICLISSKAPSRQSISSQGASPTETTTDAQMTGSQHVPQASPQPQRRDSHCK